MKNIVKPTLMQIVGLVIILGIPIICFVRISPVIVTQGIITGQTEEKIAVESSLLYSSYFGGVANDHGLCIAQDNIGNVIVAGLTYSSDFPTTEGVYDQTYNGESDIFVSKWSSDGTELLFSTLIGGNESENYLGSTGIPYHSLDIETDSEGNIIIYGTTSSADYPVTTNAINGTYNGNQDVFLTKLSSNGSTLIFSTFLGGNETDFFNLGNNRLVLDDEDFIYITGNTESSDFPLTANALNRTIQEREAFCCKISPDGSSLAYSTLLGGSEKEYSMGIALDSAKNIILGGITYSNDFPTTENAFDKTYSNADLYFTKITADGATVLYSTYMGGVDWEQLTGMIVDPNDELYFTGSTGSTDFPTTSNTVRETQNGEFDVFLGKLAADGSALLASSFVGGSSNNFASGITLSLDGPFITGYTRSTNFPTTSNAYQQGYQGQTDYFISGLNPELTSWTYSSYLGGSATEDHGHQETRNGHDAGEIFSLSTKSFWVVGSTRSDNFPVTSNTALNTSWNGASDVFVTHINYSLAPTDTTTTTSIPINTTDTNPASTAFSSVFLTSVVLAIITTHRKYRKGMR